MKTLIGLFSPNKNINTRTFTIMASMQGLILLLLWLFIPIEFMPSPVDIFHAFGRLLKNGILVDVMSSVMLSLEALFYAVVVSLLCSYLTVMAFFRPMGFFASKARFLTMVGLSFVFTLLTHGGHELKVTLLVFGMSVFFITSFISVIQTIDKDEFMLPRTLGMSEWTVVWETVVLGQLDKIIECIRQNLAISLTLLTLAEGIVRSEGGLGAMLLNENKYLKLDSVFAIQLMLFSIGVGYDIALGLLKKLACPHAALTLERK